MSRSSERLSDLEQRVSWLENEVGELRKKPAAGRRPIRIEEAMNWLRNRGGGEITEILDEASMRGFTHQLVRKAKRQLGWKRDGHRWVKSKMEPLG